MSRQIEGGANKQKGKEHEQIIEQTKAATEQKHNTKQHFLIAPIEYTQSQSAQTQIHIISGRIDPFHTVYRSVINLKLLALHG